MELLSTGEKIRRSRIENNLTLKELGNGTISVSKLSFIENDKVVPEDKEIKHISEMLKVSTDYLKMNIRDQVEKYIKENEKLRIDEITKMIDVCDKNEISEYNFDLYRILIDKYNDEKLLEEASKAFPKYWEALRKSECEENSIRFATSTIDYLILENEFKAAKAMISTLNLYTKFNTDAFVNERARVLIAEIKMWILGPQFRILDEYAKDIHDLQKLSKHLTQDNKIELDIMLCILNVIDSKIKCGDEIDKMILKLEDKKIKISDYYITLAEVYFKLGKIEEYVECLNKAESFFICAECNVYLNAVKDIIISLLTRKIYEPLSYFNNKYLDCALEQKEDEHTQFAYYIKALIGKNDSDLNNVETYLNVSLNILEKNSTAQDLKVRYQDLGELYYKKGNYKDAIKAFSRAHDLQKRY